MVDGNSIMQEPSVVQMTQDQMLQYQNFYTQHGPHYFKSNAYAVVQYYLNTKQGEVEGRITQAQTQVKQNAASILASVDQKIQDADIDQRISAYIDMHGNQIASAVSEQIYGAGQEDPLSRMTTTMIQTPTKIEAAITNQDSRLSDLQRLINTHFSFEADGLHIFYADAYDRKTFEVVLSPTKMSFLKEDQQVAYFSNDELHIDHIVTDTSIKIGNLKTSVNDGIVDWVLDDAEPIMNTAVFGQNSMFDNMLLG